MELEDVLREVAMRRAYSTDLRVRVISVCHEDGLSVAEVARRYRLGERAVYRNRPPGRALLAPDIMRVGLQAVVRAHEDVFGPARKSGECLMKQEDVHTQAAETFYTGFSG